MRMPHLILFGVVLLLSAGVAWSAGSEPVTFKGQVVDADGQAIGGADVVVLGAGKDLLLGSQTKLIAQTKADDEGAFDVTSDSVGNCDRILVTARQAGLALGSWNGALSELPESLTLKLGGAQTIVGTVLDESEQPVAGATIKAMLRWNDGDHTNSLIAHEAIPELIVKTDDTGRFEFQAVPEGAGAILAVQAEGYATQLKPESTLQGIPAGTADTKIVMLKGSTINGRVTANVEDATLKGLTVVGQFNRYPYLVDARAVTDADGKFTLTDLPVGEVKLIVVPGEVDLSQEVSEADLPFACVDEVKVAGPGGEQDVTLALQRMAILETTVMNRLSQEPVADATFHYEHRQDKLKSTVQTDEKGNGRALVLPGPYLVYAEHPDFTRNGVRRIVTLAEGQTMQVPVGLVQAQMLTGTVKDAQGNPIKDAKVEALPSSQYPPVKTDADGKFKMQWEPANWGQDITSLLIVRDVKNDLAIAVPIDDTFKSFDLTLQKGASFAGRILTEEGEPLENANVSVTLFGGNWGSSLSGENTVSSDAYGRFKVAGLPLQAGYHLSATADGYGQYVWRFDNVESTENVLDDAKLLKADQTLAGTVVDSKGKPVAKARVQIYGDDQVNKNVETDDEGKFKIEGLCKGYANLFVQAQGPPHMYGQYYAKVDQKEVKIAISEQGMNQEPEVEIVPEPIKGQQAPDLSTVGLETAPQGKPVLVLFMDVNQRSSRHALSDLLKKMGGSNSAHVVVVQVGEADDALIKAQNIKLPVARVTEDVEEVCVKWGVPAVPWYVLADPKGNVVHSGATLSAAQ